MSRDNWMKRDSFFFWTLLCDICVCGVVLQKTITITFYFQNNLFRKILSNQMASAMTQFGPCFFRNFSKTSLFISPKTEEKNIVSEKYSIPHHDNKMRLLPICRYQIELMEDNEEKLRKMDAFCLNYQHLNCLYTFFKNRFRKKMSSSEQLFDIVLRALRFNQNEQNAQHRKKKRFF